MSELAGTRLDNVDKHVAAEIDGIRRDVSTAAVVAKEARILADQVRDKRDAGMNEWRQTVQDLQGKFVDRGTYTTAHEDLERRIGKMELKDATEAGIKEQRAASEARARWVFGLAVTIVAFVVSLLVTLGFRILGTTAPKP